MPGSDDVDLFGMATMKALGLDLYPWALEKLRPSAVPVQTVVESPGFLAARLVNLSVQSLQSEVADDASADVAVERLVERGPDMFMDQMGERGTRDRALEDSVQQAEQSWPERRWRASFTRYSVSSRRRFSSCFAGCSSSARGAHEGSSEATGAGRGQTSPVRSCEVRVVSVVHRGCGGVWFGRAEHPGRVGQSSHGGATKGHFSFGQRLPGGEIAGGADSEGDDWFVAWP